MEDKHEHLGSTQNGLNTHQSLSKGLKIHKRLHQEDTDILTY
jgi:hypothetical protein